jgi:hypothetical protein
MGGTVLTRRCTMWANIVVSYLIICFCVATIAIVVHGLEWLEQLLGGDDSEQKDG